MTQAGQGIDFADAVVTRHGRTYVPFPVPLEYVAEVTALVARLEQEASEAAAPAPSEPVGRGSAASVAGNPNGVWSEPQLRALAEAGTASAERVVAMMAALGRVGPDILMSTRNLAEATGIEDRFLRSALSKLTLFVTTRPEVYDVVCWPFGWRYGAQVDPDSPREFHYYFSREQHAAWAAVLG